MSWLTTRSHPSSRARAYGFSRSGAFCTRSARSFISRGGCAFTTRSWFVLLAAGCHYSAVLGRGHPRTSSLRPRLSTRYSAGSGPGPRCRFRCTRTCCGMAAAMPGECRPRHSCAAGLPQAYLGAQEHPPHGEVHRTGAGSVQEFLALSVPYRAYRSAAKFEGLYGCLNVIRIAF
jgi:hypothetical protein